MRRRNMKNKKTKLAVSYKYGKEWKQGRLVSIETGTSSTVKPSWFLLSHPPTVFFSFVKKGSKTKRQKLKRKKEAVFAYLGGS